MSTELGRPDPQYSQLTDQGDETSILISTQDPITLYNKFIRIYNVENNKVNGITLKYLQPSKVVQFVHNYLRNNIGMLVLLLIFIFLPFINIFFYLLLWIAWIRLTQNYKIFRENLKSVMDPFINMVENSDICEMMKQNYWHFNLDIKETEGLHFANQVKEMIKSRSNGNNKIQFTVYNQVLKEQYYGYPNSRVTYMKWIVCCTIIVAIQLTLIIIFFDDI